MKKLPDHLSGECIIAAIRAYDAGVAHQFKSARLYEIEFEGRRYPSKAIVGLAATLATGTEFTPADFSGGLNPNACACYWSKDLRSRRRALAMTRLRFSPMRDRRLWSSWKGRRCRWWSIAMSATARLVRRRFACTAAGVRYAVWIWPAAMAKSARFYPYPPSHSAVRNKAGLPSEP